MDEQFPQVQQNVDELLEQVRGKAADLEKQIRVFGAKKLDSLRSRKHLAERNLAGIEWASSFADYITDHKIMPAEAFLQSAKHHERLIESMVENVVSVDEEQFLEKADLQLEGRRGLVWTRNSSWRGQV